MYRCFVCWLYLTLLCFVKQKTAYEMRISDWSSDVCSSDLMPLVGLSSVAAVRVMVKRMSSFLHEEGNSLAGTSVPPSETARLRSPTANPVHKIALPSCGHTNFTGHHFRSEERRVGNECVSTLRSRGSPYN